MSSNAEAVKFYNEGIGHYNNDKYDEAIERFEKAIEIDKNYADAYNYRGLAYRRKGEYDEAIKDYNKAIEIDENYVNAYNNRGYTYRRKGEYDEAIKNYDEAIRLNPNDALYYSNRGYAYYNKGEYDEAIKNYDKAIRLNPDSTLYDSNKILAQNDKTRKIAEDVTLQYKKELDDLKKYLDIDAFKNDAIAHLDEIHKTHESSKTAYEEITGIRLGVRNYTLAQYYQAKADELKRQLSSSLSKEPSKFFCFSFKKPVKIFGFIQCFWILLILIVVGLLVAGNELSENPTWLDVAIHSIKYSPALILSVWGVRYFNRRIHETVHLIEEYENKAIILMSFESYSERLKVLGGTDQAALLKYTEKVSHIITESPTYALHRKKTDKIPIELLQLFTSYQNKSEPKKP